MTKKRNSGEQKSRDRLRRQAEARLKSISPGLETFTTEEGRALVYELQVHQIELEIQNEDLRDTQQELAATFERFRTLYNLAPIGFLGIEPDGRIREANLAAAGLLGSDRATLQRSNIWTFVSREFRDAVYLHLREVFASGANAVREIEMLRADGSRFAAQLESVAAGSPTDHYCQTALSDISEHVMARRALTELNVELGQSLENTEHDLHDKIGELRVKDAAIENLGEGVMITGDGRDWPEPIIRYVNPAMCRISGYREDELIGATPRILQGEGSGRDRLDHIRHELSANRPVQVEMTNYRKDGGSYETELYVSPLFDTDGRRSDFVSIHRDITLRKQAERELYDRNAWLEAILNTTAEAVVTINGQGTIETVNPATETLFGYSADELVGHNVSILMPSPWREEHDAYIERYLRTGEARIIGRHRELLARHRNGKNFPIALSVSRIDNQQRFAGFIRNLSEVRDLQRQVLNAAGNEDQRIGQELHDNIQQQLTGLALIAGNLADSLADAASKEGGTAARLETEIRHVIAQIRSLSRGLVPVDVDAEGLRSALERLVSRIDKTTDMECRFRAIGNIRLANNVLATHLYRIAQEAINNVLRHSRAGHLEVSLERNGDSISLQIEDDGIGIGDSSSTDDGYGLRIMRYRANLIGATCHVGPGARGGMRLACVLPARTIAPD